MDQQVLDRPSDLLTAPPALPAPAPALTARIVPPPPPLRACVVPPPPPLLRAVEAAPQRQPITRRRDAASPIVAASGRRHPAPTARTSSPSGRAVVGRLAAAGLSSTGFLFGVASLASARLEGSVAADPSGPLPPSVAPAAITRTIYVDQFGNPIPDPTLVPFTTAPVVDPAATDAATATVGSVAPVDPTLAAGIDSAVLPAAAIVPPPVVPAPEPVAPNPVPPPPPKSVVVPAPAPVAEPGAAPQPEAVEPAPVAELAPPVEQPVIDEPAVPPPPPEQPPVVEQAPPEPAPVVEQPVNENPPAPACEGSVSC